MPRRLGVSLICGCLFGCGLADYEKRIDQQAARLKVLDENNKHLGPAISNPSDWPFTVCLRLPKDMQPSPEEKPLTSKDVKVFVFGSKKSDGQKVFVAVAEIGEKDKNGKFKDGEPSEEEFRNRFRQALIDVTSKEKERILLDFPGAKEEKDSRPVDALDGTPTTTLELTKQIVNGPGEEAYQMAIFFHQKGNHQAAVAFQALRQRADQGDAMKAIDLSLKSLEIGPNAAVKKKAFDQLRPKS